MANDDIKEIVRAAVQAADRTRERLAAEEAQAQEAKASATDIWLAKFMANDLPRHLREGAEKGAVSIHLSSGDHEVPDDQEMLKVAAKRIHDLLGLECRVELEKDCGMGDDHFRPMWQLYIDL